MSLLESRTSAREIRRRLFNPPNGHESSELEILNESARRREKLLTPVHKVQDEAVEMASLSEEERRQLYTQAFAECLTIMREALGDAGLIIARELIAQSDDPEKFKDGELIKPVRIVDVIRAVCAFYSIPVSELLADRRSGPMVRARHIAMYICRKTSLKSFPEIGRRLGNRDHSTVIHGVAKIEDLLLTDEELRDEIESIKRSLGLR